MYQKNIIDKGILKYLLTFSVIVLLVFIAVAYKNDKTIKNIEKRSSIKIEDFTVVKDFFLSKIRSPYSNINYIIKSGDSIQKILKELNLKNTEIQQIIKEYKKYSSISNLLPGNKINIIIKENLPNKDNSIIEFSIPITKSTTVEINRDEMGNIKSQKIITQLYKKQIIAENIIKNSLYKSATDVKINSSTIIEFARIFGFEIDFQRDIRKNDYFQIVYDKFFDENGVFIKSGAIYYAHMSVNGREITLYRFGNDKKYSYFDINGKSVEKALMKSPINGARLSSPFGMRKHPILG